MNEIDRIEHEFSVIGDSDTTALATGGIAELLKGIGGIAASTQKKKEDDAKTKDTQAKIAAARAARLDATLAAAKALKETDPAGPLHEAALRAEMKAQELEAAAGGSSLMPYGAGGLQPASGASWFSKMNGPLSNGSWLAIGLGSAAAIGLTVYLVKRK